MSLTDLLINVVALGLVAIMGWSLWSLSNAPLNSVQRLWWVFAVIILPGVGALAWLWWIKRYYPRRKAQDPRWDPAAAPHGAIRTGRPRPSRGRYRTPGED